MDFGSNNVLLYTICIGSLLIIVTVWYLIAKRFSKYAHFHYQQQQVSDEIPTGPVANSTKQRDDNGRQSLEHVKTRERARQLPLLPPEGFSRNGAVENNGANYDYDEIDDNVLKQYLLPVSIQSQQTQTPFETGVEKYR